MIQEGSKFKNWENVMKTATTWLVDLVKHHFQKWEITGFSMWNLEYFEEIRVGSQKKANFPLNCGYIFSEQNSWMPISFIMIYLKACDIFKSAFFSVIDTLDMNLLCNSNQCLSIILFCMLFDYPVNILYLLWQ